MKKKIWLKIIYVFSVFSIFLPWFTYDADMMGYCWGYQFLKWLIVPMAILAIYLFEPEENKLFFILSELSALANLTILVFALGRWQEACNINTGFQWRDGFYTAMPTFWLTFGLFLVFFVLLQYTAFNKKSK